MVEGNGKGYQLGAWIVSVVISVMIAAPHAAAGVPECGNLRIESLTSCRVVGDLECEGGCTKLGVYRTACATKLQTVCRSECTLDPEPTCTDECTESCQASCDLGLNITCQHNCFRECSGVCDGECAGAEKPEQCRASCEATCDGSCDVQCAPVVSESCYVHCLECCGGSCGAQANMNCQETCQDQQFETCEHDLEIECGLSCGGEGALFCDGEYALSGEQIGPCVDALLQRASVTAEVLEDVGTDLNRAARCSLTRGNNGGTLPLGGGAAFCSLLLLGLARRHRRGRSTKTRG